MKASPKGKQLLTEQNVEYAGASTPRRSADLFSWPVGNGRSEGDSSRHEALEQHHHRAPILHDRWGLD